MALRRRSRVLILVIAAVIVVAAVATILVLTLKPTRDAHAKAACSGIERAQSSSLFDAVILDLKAVNEAKQSSSDGLAEAANTTSPASNLPPDNPLYENPGDVQVQAVAYWCAHNP